MTATLERDHYSAATETSKKQHSIPASSSSSSSATSSPSPPQQPPSPPPQLLAYREFRGNGKRIVVELNAQHLRIVGNGNHILVYRNCGHLEILGNANRVRVLKNPHGGRIQYSGNDGRVYLCESDVVHLQAATPTTSASGLDDEDECCRKAALRRAGINCAVRLVTREEMLRAITAAASSAR